MAPACSSGPAAAGATPTRPNITTTTGASDTDSREDRRIGPSSRVWDAGGRRPLEKPHFVVAVVDHPGAGRAIPPGLHRRAARLVAEGIGVVRPPGAPLGQQA